MFGGFAILYGNSIFPYTYLHLSTLVLCDNQFALHMATNLMFHARTRHININMHCIHELVAHETIRL